MNLAFLCNIPSARFCICYNHEVLNLFFCCKFLKVRSVFDRLTGLITRSINSWKMFIKLFQFTRFYLFLAYNTGQYVYDIYCKFLLNMFIRKKVTHVLVTYANKHCRAPNKKITLTSFISLVSVARVKFVHRRMFLSFENEQNCVKYS